MAFDETHTLVAGRHWWYLRITPYPCDRSLLAPFQINTYSWGGMALVAFEKKQHTYPCGRMALVAYKLNTYLRELY